MNNEIPKKSERSGALDLFRFLAVLTIFLAHYTDTFNFRYGIVPANLKWIAITRYSSMALIVFFMISGYVITMTSIKRNFKDFAIARLSRLYPLFWVSCITEFFLVRIVNDHTYLTQAPFKLLLYNLTLMPQLFGYEMINPVFYTLLIELFFYLFIGLIIIFKLWNRILIVFSCLFIYCIVSTIHPATSAGGLVLPFTAGMLLYFIKAKYNVRWKVFSLYVINYICSLLTCMPIIKDPGKSFTDSSPLNMWLVFAIITIIYLALYLIADGKMAIKSTSITHTLGEIAYPFYLFHLYFLFLYWYFSTTIQPDLLLLGVLILILATSLLINVWVEKPLSKLASQILQEVINIFSRRKKN